MCIPNATSSFRRDASRDEHSGIAYVHHTAVQRSKLSSQLGLKDVQEGYLLCQVI